MPTIFFHGPKLEKDKKRELIKAFTKAGSEATGIPEAGFVVYLKEVSADQVGVGGILLEDKQK